MTRPNRDTRATRANLNSNTTGIAIALADALKRIPGMKVRRCGGRLTLAPADAVLRKHQALSCGALATDHEGMARAGRVARARDSMENAFPGSLKTWDRMVRREASKARAAGKLGAR